MAFELVEYFMISLGFIIVDLFWAYDANLVKTNAHFYAIRIFIIRYFVIQLNIFLDISLSVIFSPILSPVSDL